MAVSLTDARLQLSHSNDRRDVKLFLHRRYPNGDPEFVATIDPGIDVLDHSAAYTGNVTLHHHATLISVPAMPPGRRRFDE
jgi:hypothetical protein